MMKGCTYLSLSPCDYDRLHQDMNKVDDVIGLGQVLNCPANTLQANLQGITCSFALRDSKGQEDVRNESCAKACQ